MTNTVTIMNHGPLMINVAGGALSVAGVDLAPGEFKLVTLWADGGSLTVTEPNGFPTTHEELKALREQRPPPQTE